MKRVKRDSYKGWLKFWLNGFTRIPAPSWHEDVKEAWEDGRRVGLKEGLKEGLAKGKGVV